MNLILHTLFSLSVRFFGFSTAVAAVAFYSALFVFAYVYFFAQAAKLPHISDLVIIVAGSLCMNTLGHGSQFGFLSSINIPAWDKTIRFINDRISVKGAPAIKQDLSVAEHTDLLKYLIALPKKNGKIATFWATTSVIITFAFALYGNYFDPQQFIVVLLIAVLAVILHGLLTFIFSEMCVSRLVSDCREKVLANDPFITQLSASSLRGKFLILGYAFVTALINLFAIVYFGRENLQTIIAALVYSIVLMSALAYIVLYRINSSLQEIRRTSSNLRAGEQILTYSKSMDAEFVDIADGLNNATLSIQDHQQNLENRIADRTKELSLERDKSEKLLLNILPQSIADELKQYGSAKSTHFDSVTVLFTDFVGFTKIAENLSPTDLIGELDRCFSYFDNVAVKYGLEKLKTIGDAYMAAGGIPVKNHTHTIDCALGALEIQAFMNQMKGIKESQGYPYWELRLGMHTGALVAGVVGERKFAYDVWGDTVNTASRMESSGTPGAINISRELYDSLRFLFACEYRGKVYAKNKGEIDMYYLRGIKAKFSVGGEGRVPNAEFKSIYEKVKAGQK